jgi:hypothetical protein
MDYAFSEALGDNHAFGGSISETDQCAGRRCGIFDCVAGFRGRDFPSSVGAARQRIDCNKPQNVGRDFPVIFSRERLLATKACRTETAVYIAFKKLSPESQGTQL